MKYSFNIVLLYLESSKAFPPWVGAIADMQAGLYSKYIFRTLLKTTIFARRSKLDVWKGLKYVSMCFMKTRCWWNIRNKLECCFEKSRSSDVSDVFKNILILLSQR